MFLFSFVLKIWLMGCAFCACLAYFFPPFVISRIFITLIIRWIFLLFSYYITE